MPSPAIEPATLRSQTRLSNQLSNGAASSSINIDQTRNLLMISITLKKKDLENCHVIGTSLRYGGVNECEIATQKKLKFC